MVTIRYSLTPDDYAAFELERRGGIGRRILRIASGVLCGLIGLVFVWQAFFFFPWNRWSGHLLIAGLGLVFLWIGFELPGLNWLLLHLSKPYADRELQVYEGKIVCSDGGKASQFRWLPKRGFKESENFFYLKSFGSDAGWTIPKRAVAPEQERGLRQLVEEKALLGDAIECRFSLTQEELAEASAAADGHRWLRTWWGKVFARVVFATGAAVCLWIPTHTGTSWIAGFRNEPGANIGVMAIGLFCFWGVTGFVGLKALNRLDQERQIRISDGQIEVTSGRKTHAREWKRFYSYSETPNVFVLRPMLAVEFLTIPKRALQSGDEERLRALLDNKLPSCAARSSFPFLTA